MLLGRPVSGLALLLSWWCALLGRTGCKLHQGLPHHASMSSLWWQGGQGGRETACTGPPHCNRRPCSDSAPPVTAGTGGTRSARSSTARRLPRSGTSPSRNPTPPGCPSSLLLPLTQLFYPFLFRMHAQVTFRKCHSVDGRVERKGSSYLSAWLE